MYARRHQLRLIFGVIIASVVIWSLWAAFSPWHGY